MDAMIDEHLGEKAEKDEILPFNMTHVTQAMMEVARAELNETDEVRVEALEKFRKMINEEKTLTIPTDDLFLLSFLRSRNFNVKEAFTVLRNYWMFRIENRHIYTNINVQSVSRLILHNIVGLLWYRDRNGCIVFILKYTLWNPEQDTFEDLIRATTSLLVCAAEFSATQIYGFRLIFDIRGLSWIQMKYLTPSNLLLLTRSTQFCFPARYKGIHLITDSTMVNFILIVIYPLLASKLRKRIIIHNDSNLETIKDYIHPTILPAEFGGEAPEFNNSKWTEIVESVCHKLVEQQAYGYMQ